MGGGGGDVPESTTQHVINELPAYARPYYLDIMKRSQAESNRQYEPYGGQRIAGFTPGQEKAQQMAYGMQRPGQFGTATDLTTKAAQGMLQMGNYNPAQFSAQQVNAPNLQQYQMNAPEQFTGAQVDKYMSPYMEKVMDIQKRNAVMDAQRANLSNKLAATRQGSYGGSRQALMEAQRENALGLQLGDIEAKGRQAAFENAQAQFERDRTAGMTAQQANLKALLDTQQLGANTGMQAQLANQQYGLEAQKLGELSRQFGSNLGLQGLQGALQAGQQMGALGTAQQQADMQRMQAIAAAGAEERGYQQQLMDTAYADFLRQRDYPMERLNQYASLLHGVPVQLNSTAITYGPQPSALAQAAGAGLSAASLYNMYSSPTTTTTAGKK